MNTRFFIPKPTPSTQTESVKNPENGQKSNLPIYLDEAGNPMKWSGKFPVPEIGSQVYIVMNNIGWTIVKGYFYEAGYVGVMTLPIRPPKWLRDQRKEARSRANTPMWVQRGIGCEFGSEILLERPQPHSLKSRSLC